MAKTAEQILAETMQAAEEEVARKAATPTQRTRQALQGLTFGGADEAEAWLRSLGGRDYDEVVAEVRGQLKDYQNARPLEAIGYEVGGAVLPAIIGSMFSGGVAGGATLARLAAKYPRLAKIAGVSAPTSIGDAAITATAQGALSGFGHGEGDALDRMYGTAVGAGLGGVGGTALYAGAPMVTKPFVALVDIARRKLGNTGGKAVETELQRLATEGGITVDEVVEGVLNGKIMAENRTLLDAVRTFRATGGKAAGMLRETLERRPGETRQVAVNEINKYLSEVKDPNILRGMKASDEEAKRLEKQAYAPFREVKVETDDLFRQLELVLERAPEAAKQVEQALFMRSGQKPYFTVADDGSIIFTRQPTMEEAEQVRRSLSQITSKLYKGDAGVVGEEAANLQQGLRAAIDDASPEMAATRAQAATVRNARDAFRDGQKALAKSADQVEIEFADVQALGDSAVSAYRAGVMQAYRNKMGTGSKASLMKNLADEENKLGAILRIVMPEDQLPQVLQKVDVAAGAQNAANRVLGGSDTAVTSSLQKRQGMNIGGDEIAEVVTSPNPINIYRLLRKVTQRAAPGLTDAEREQVVKVLISRDPDMVRNALNDTSGMAVLQRAIEGLAQTFQSGATNVGARQTQGVLDAVMQ